MFNLPDGCGRKVNNKMTIVDSIMLSIGSSVMFFVASFFIVILVVYTLRNKDDLFTGLIGATIVFIGCVFIFTSQLTIQEDYNKMKAELNQIKDAAVKAGLGHYKETIVETKKEFVIGTFTAEVERVNK